MEYHKLWLNKCYFCFWFLHFNRDHEAGTSHAYWVMLLFPVVLCFCKCLWIWSRMLFISEPVFLWPLWSLKLFSTAKDPFNKDFTFFSLLQNPGSEKLHACSQCVVVHECDDFMVTCYVLTTGPKANQNTSFTWCSDLQVSANQIIFHTFWKKSRDYIHD